MPDAKVDASQLPCDLGDGLVLRRSQVSDAEALAKFTAMVHSDEGPDKPDERVYAWTYDLMARPHPTFKPGDFTIVEQAATGRMVSCMNLIPQTWTYAGIPFKVGRPELVATLPEFRNRGLVRLQFDVIHQWSAAYGELLQVITGIPYYYRQFGYEMALNLGGGRAGFPTHIPRLQEGEQEPFSLRPATHADIPFITELYESGCRRSLVACQRDGDLWRYEVEGRSAKNVNRFEVRLIETQDGKPAGFITHPPFSWGDMMAITRYELHPDYPWLAVTPSVIRYLEAAYTHYSPEHGEKKTFGAFGFWLGEDHPAYFIRPDHLPRVRNPYAWYLRVVDLPDFLQLVKPALEGRLAGSSMAGYSGEVKITFYRDGIRLLIEKGKLSSIEAWKPTPVGNAGNAGFPPHTFLQLLFGYRPLDMLKASFVDCWTDSDQIHMLLAALFPRQPSDVLPIA